MKPLCPNEIYSRICEFDIDSALYVQVMGGRWLLECFWCGGPLHVSEFLCAYDIEPDRWIALECNEEEVRADLSFVSESNSVKVYSCGIVNGNVVMCVV